jgi:hypothetical protein
VPARRNPFQYAILRVVPDLARGEALNVGVILFAPTKRFLGTRVALDEDRLAALAPGWPAARILPHLEAIEHISAGRPEGGPLAASSLAERFHWLVAPSSTSIQASEVHTGLCTDPAAELDRLFRTLVERPRPD